MRVFQFGNVTAVLDAAHEVTGYAAGDDVIKAERSVDGASHVMGADGSMAMAISSDKSGTVTFKLLQTSSTNRYLLQRYALQEAGSRTFTPISLNVKDVHRLDVIIGIAGYLKKLPMIQRGEKTAEQEWSIVFQQLWFDLGDAMGIGSPSITVENLG
jgi:hypothetical protein